MSRYAQVIIDISLRELDRPFTYRIPGEMADRLRLGSLVVVPFGSGNVMRKAYVIGLADSSDLPEEKLKDIAEVAREGTDETGAYAIRLAAWMQHRYGSTMAAALKTVLTGRRQVKPIETKSVRLLLDETHAREQLCLYEKKHQVARARVMRGLLESPVQPYSLIIQKLHIAPSAMKAMEKAGVIRIESHKTLRNPVCVDASQGCRLTLSPEQEAIAEGVLADFHALSLYKETEAGFDTGRKTRPEGGDLAARRVSLLHGITGSGKTEVYIRIIERIVAEGRQAIMLIPEISLTYQTLLRFYRHFGDRVSVMNSTLSEGEKSDQFERARSGEIDVIIGPRSALFTPFPRIGVIVIDEEHESSYKNEQMPKYHARETSIEIARMHGAVVVLGSATPSIDSYDRAVRGEYRLYHLSRRLTGGGLTAEMKTDVTAGGAASFHSETEAAETEAAETEAAETEAAETEAAETEAAETEAAETEAAETEAAETVAAEMGAAAPLQPQDDAAPLLPRDNPVPLPRDNPSPPPRDNPAPALHADASAPEVPAPDSGLPTVEITDMREELRAGNRSVLSRRLSELIEGRLERGEQTMLFLNRRGFSGFVSCRSCGYVPRCPHCSVSLSLHTGRSAGMHSAPDGAQRMVPRMDEGNAGVLVCHYCGYTEPMPTACPECGSQYISGFRAGTEQVETMLRHAFPEARILRMDADTTRAKGSYERILSGFANEEADILIGTQMIVKGHDFPNVTLMGILLADMSLYANDYRAAERTFQLLTQAAGRAGRGRRRGEVIIQTYEPEHYAIVHAAHQDYEGFYREEIAYRRILRYPPAEHLLAVQIISKNEDHAQLFAGQTRILLEKLRERICSRPSSAGAAASGTRGAGDISEELLIIGPSSASIEKLRDEYRYAVYIKSPDYAKLIACKDGVEAAAERSREAMPEMDTYFQFDFDPVNPY